jgi:predicted glycogen debranching enzyme
VWYRNFRYDEEFARGFSETEDLASPGILEFDLSKPAIWFLTTDASVLSSSVETQITQVRGDELRRRTRFDTRLHKAADSYIVQRGKGKTIVAGYPWFTDWGRDTFIALRGLCIAAGRLEEAEGILLEWASQTSQGMLPNRFADKGDTPEFNSVDASLWYVIGVYEYLKASEVKNRMVADDVRNKLRAAVDAILDGFERGTRYRIKADVDGLLMAGEPGLQLTWMDARVGNWVITPRIGKPVEIQALWLNALHIGAFWSNRWYALYQKAMLAFEQRFWNTEGGYLYDVVDVDHQSGRLDASFRPNQILAVGGLPFALLEGDKAKAVVDAVEARLVTPLGLRSLEPSNPAYRGHYGGDVVERDSAYHQGTAWPWLMGPFVEAWVGVRGGTNEVKQEARTKFLQPLMDHLDKAGLGHICEIADGDMPYRPGGCPFQAWSVGEALRLEQVVLRESALSPRRPSIPPAPILPKGRMGEVDIVSFDQINPPLSLGLGVGVRGLLEVMR